MMCFLQKHIRILFSLFLVLSGCYQPSYAQIIESFPIQSMSASKSGVKVALYDTDNLLWYTNANGIVLETGNSHFFYPYEKLDGKEVFVRKPEKLFLSSTNKLWIICEKQAVYCFDIKKRKGSWLLLDDAAFFADVAEDAFGNLWFGTYYDYVVSFNQKSKKSKRHYITQSVYNGNYETDKDLNEYLITVFKLKTTLLFRQGTRFFYFEKRVSSEVTDIQSSLLKTKKADIFPANIGDFYHEQKSSVYYFNDQAYRINYHAKLDCHFIETPIGISKSRKGYDRATQPRISFSKIIPQDCWLSTDNDFVYMNAKDNVLFFYTIVEENRRNVLERIKSVNLNNYIQKVVIGHKEISAFTEVSIEILAFEKSIFKTFLAGMKPPISTRKIIETQDGFFYVLTRQGIFKKEKDTFYAATDTLPLSNEFRLFLHGSIDMLLDDENLFWVVGIDDNLLKLDLTDHANQKIYKAYDVIDDKENFFSINNDFYRVFPLKKHRLLLAGGTGLHEFNKNTESFINRNALNGTKHIKYISSCMGTDDGFYWLATDIGILKIDQNYNILKHIKKEALPKEVVENRVTSLFLSTKGKLWIVFEDNYIVKYDVHANTIAVDDFYKDHFLKIAAIIQDGTSIWVSTFNGLFVETSQQPMNRIKYTVKDGLPDNEFNINSALKTKDSTLLFGGMNGLVSFKKKNPKVDSIDKQRLKLTEYITYSSVTDYTNITQNLDSITSFQVDYYNNNLNLRFTTNKGIASAKNQKYSYRIPQLSDRWIDVGSSGFIQLQGLNAGTYKLDIKANYNSKEDSNIMTYTLNVKQVFFKEFWFQCILLVMFIGLIIGIICYRKRLKKNKRNISIKIKELELEAVQAQMNPHFIHNTINNLQNVLMRGAIKDVNIYFHEFTNLIQLTLEMSRLKKITLTKEIEYLHAYLTLSQMRLNNELKFSIVIPPEIKLHTMLIPPLLIQPIVENAIIHGLKPKEGEKIINISLSYKENILSIDVFDNGIGRKQSSQIQKQSIINKCSLSSDILKKRLLINNFIDPNAIIIDINDLNEGTLVKVKIKI